jgi:broad specificity phosphatase PhoE
MQVIVAASAGTGYGRRNELPPADAGLDEQGRNEAVRLGDELRGFTPRCIGYVSTGAARETAAIVGKGLPCPAKLIEMAGVTPNDFSGYYADRAADYRYPHSVTTSADNLRRVVDGIRGLPQPYTALVILDPAWMGVPRVPELVGTELAHVPYGQIIAVLSTTANASQG